MKHKMAVAMVSFTMFSAVGVVGLTEASNPSTEHVSTTGVDSGSACTSVHPDPVGMSLPRLISQVSLAHLAARVPR